MARIPIAEVTAIGYVTPIFITVGAAIFLGERLRLHRIMGVLAGLLGALIVLRPGFQEISIEYHFDNLSTLPFPSFHPYYMHFLLKVNYHQVKQMKQNYY